MSDLSADNESSNFNTEAVDETVLALLQLTLHDGDRAWKGHDWDALDRLYKRVSLKIPSARPNLSC
ncbi:hypothetical protein CAGGBEG34_270028 [Candidatus Glomeribacter gigasporarum BEG34]|uniref:DUF6429 domain-containing protein n=1 Tax=Candidatus Glomeribacter gigasporarum BEG34 TaxID=1070319 RepID=G2JA22_9BURK|nr:hypothetical protein CAGGBEG34_270028 [Candidatus Glomeribacter gigasporarum BEG34]